MGKDVDGRELVGDDCNPSTGRQCVQCFRNLGARLFSDRIYIHNDANGAKQLFLHNAIDTRVYHMLDLWEISLSPLYL